MNKSSRIYVAGHNGMVGSALVRKLRKEGTNDLLLRTRAELDLLNTGAVDQFFHKERPEYVFLSAARVGGILANNNRPADFIRENLIIQNNIIDSAWKHGVKKLLFLGSSCIYPRDAEQPITEDSLLTGPLESTNEWYAIAKIAGIKLCQALRRQYKFDAISVMPTNLYGPGDNFSLTDSHVLPALMRKFHDAKITGSKEVVIWGTGTARREFLHVDDLADALLYIMRNYSEEQILNVGCSKDIPILDLAKLLSEIVGFGGKLSHDLTKPDGTPRKLLDTSRLSDMGWEPKISLEEGMRQTYEWFLSNYSELRR